MRGHRLPSAATAAVVAVLAVLALSGSRAAFDATTETPRSTFAAGHVELTEDAPGALFLGDDLAPGRAVERCVSVAYRGSIVPVDVRLHGRAAGELAPHLQLSVDRGAGGGAGDCTGFTPSARVFTGRLAELPPGYPLATATRIATTPASLTYRIVVTPTGDAAAQGTAASAEFVWEARP